MGHLADARVIWTDLAAEIERSKTVEPGSAASLLRARALYEIALTYGMPQPADDASLSLGVAAIRRALAAYPAGSHGRSGGVLTG